MRNLFEQLSKTRELSATSVKTPKSAYDYAGTYDVVFPQRKGQPKPIVLRANIRGLYGKVDTYGYSITPRRARISQLKVSTDETHEVLDIVKESFEEMAEYYSQLGLRGKLNLDSKTLGSLEPVRSWEDSFLSYERYQKEIVEDFISQKNTDLPEIIDYKSFETSFMEHVRSIDKPFTMSGYQASKHSDSRETGLVIDLSKEDFSNDTAKYEEYVKDKNFQVFRKVVNRFGFRIDKHIPWRVYFDVSHEYTKRKFSKYGISDIESFFERYYHRTVQLETENIASTLTSAYKAFYTADPVYFVSKPCSSGTNTILDRRHREIVTIPKQREKYGEDYWLRAYVYFRSIETSQSWNQSKFDRVVREAANMRRYRSIKQMYTYLEPKFLDKTLELFHKRDLTDENSFDTMITGFKF
jgi:hypothetical protein